MGWSRAWILVVGLGALLGMVRGESGVEAPHGQPIEPAPTGASEGIEETLGELTGDRVVHSIEVPAHLPTGARLEILLGPSFRVLAEDALRPDQGSTESRQGLDDTTALAATCQTLDQVTPGLSWSPGNAEAASEALALTRRLLEQRRQVGRWGPTHTRTRCLTSLVAFAQAYEREAPDFVVDLWLDGEVVGSPLVFRSARQGSRLTVATLPSSLAGRRIPLEIRKRGVGRVVYTVRWVLPKPPVRLAAHPSRH